MPLQGPTCKSGLARIQVKLNSKLGPSMAILNNHTPLQILSEPGGLRRYTILPHCDPTCKNSSQVEFQAGPEFGKK